MTHPVGDIARTANGGGRPISWPRTPGRGAAAAEATGQRVGRQPSPLCSSIGGGDPRAMLVAAVSPDCVGMGGLADWLLGRAMAALLSA